MDLRRIINLHIWTLFSCDEIIFSNISTVQLFDNFANNIIEKLYNIFNFLRNACPDIHVLLKECNLGHETYKKKERKKRKGLKTSIISY